MPGQTEPEPVYVDEHHQRITEFAADYMDDDERDEFVDQLMERRGYTRIQGWGPPEDDDPEPPSRTSPRSGGRAPAAPPAQPRKRPGYFKR